MNVAKVNGALLKGITAFQMSENQNLIETYVGNGGNFGSPDTAPSGDPQRGGDGGVNNSDSDVDAFDAYIEQTMMSVSARCSISPEEALDALAEVADEMAENGQIPPMPDPESASAEELSAWAGAAKTAGLVGEVIRSCMDDGDIGHVGVGG
jgi:hypothetical protein